MNAAQSLAKNKIFDLVLISCSLVFASHTSFAQDAMSFDEFQKKISIEIEAGERKEVLQSSGRYNDLRYQSTLYESPWTLNTDINTYASTDRAMAKSIPGMINVTFLNRNGLEFKSETSFFQPIAPSDTSVVPIQGQFTIGKDISKGGSRSPLNIRADIERSEARSSYFDAESNYLSEIQKKQVYIVQYFNLLCRLQDLDAVGIILAEILHAAEVKLQSKSMSLPDYLLLKNVQNQLEQQRQEYIEDQGDVEARFSDVGTKAIWVARSLLRQKAKCQDPLEIKLEKNDPNRINDEFVRSLPAIQSFEFRKEAQKKNIELLRKEMKWSLVPYLGLGFYSDNPSNYNRGQGIIGFRFSYNFAGENKNLEIRSAAERSHLLDEMELQTILDFNRDLKLLYRTMAHAAESIEVAKKTIIDSKKLIEVIRVQLKIGLIDLTVTTQAYRTYLEALNVARSAWEKSLIARLEIAQLEKSKSRVAEKLKSSATVNR